MKFHHLVVVLLAGVVACSGKGTPAAFFVPPSGGGQPSPLLTHTQEINPSSSQTAELPTTPRPSLTPTCTPGLTYLEDLTLPDGTLVEPGQTLDKRWRVQNSGTCNWDKRYGIQLIAGPELGAPAEQALYPARSGTQAVIRILFTAPKEPGTYRSAWQAVDQNNELFGDPFFIEIVVQGQ